MFSVFLLKSVQFKYLLAFVLVSVSHVVLLYCSSIYVYRIDERQCLHGRMDQCHSLQCPVNNVVEIYLAVIHIASLFKISLHFFFPLDFPACCERFYLQLSFMVCTVQPKLFIIVFLENLNYFRIVFQNHWLFEKHGRSLIFLVTEFCCRCICVMCAAKHM